MEAGVLTKMMHEQRSTDSTNRDTSQTARHDGARVRVLLLLRNFATATITSASVLVLSTVAALLSTVATLLATIRLGLIAAGCLLAVARRRGWALPVHDAGGLVEVRPALAGGLPEREPSRRDRGRGGEAGRAALGGVAAVAWLRWCLAVAWLGRGLAVARLGRCLAVAAAAVWGLLRGRGLLGVAAVLLLGWVAALVEAW